MHYIDNELLQQLKDRTTVTLATRPEDLDERIVDLIREVNAIPGIATTFSCSGHTPDEQKQKYQESKARYDRFHHYDPIVEFTDFKVAPMEDAHIIFAVTEEGQPFIDAILKYMMEQDQLERASFKPSLTLVRLLNPSATGVKEHYPAWKFSISFTTLKVHASYVITKFQEVLDKYKVMVNKVTKPLVIERQRGVVLIQNGNVSAISLLAYISKIRHKDDVINYHLTTDRLTDANMLKAMSPLEEIDFKGQRSRVVSLRDLADGMHFVGVRGDGVYVVFNRITSTITFDIDPVNKQAIDLLRIIQPQLFEQK